MLSRLTRKRYVKATILVIVVIGSLAAFWFGLKAILRTEFPLLAVDSIGMRPALNFGDLIMVQGVPNVSEIKAVAAPNGDILIFFRPSEPDVLLIRRAVNITFQDNAWYIRTQADENPSPDRWGSGQNPEDTWGDGYFHQKFLVGKVVGKIPLLGYLPLYVSAFLQTPAAMFLFIALMFLVILITYPSLQKRKFKPQAKAL